MVAAKEEPAADVVRAQRADVRRERRGVRRTLCGDPGLNYLGVRLATVSTYRMRGQMPPDHKLGRTQLWRPRTIIQWSSARPGRSKRASPRTWTWRRTQDAPRTEADTALRRELATCGPALEISSTSRAFSWRTN